MRITEQMQQWSGRFGEEYTGRNALSPEQLEALYLKNYGVGRVEMNTRFLQGFDRSIRILEVGANVGNQLRCLQAMGFTRLAGIEVQPRAVELARTRASGIDIREGSAFDLPWADDSFDLVFTSGVLIHVAPADLGAALDEIHRCALSRIWGFEYFAPAPTEVAYRGARGLLWKDDFARRYLERFDDLALVREERFRYLENNNVDTMFLLEKRVR